MVIHWTSIVMLATQIIFAYGNPLWYKFCNKLHRQLKLSPENKHNTKTAWIAFPFKAKYHMLQNVFEIDTKALNQMDYI